MIAGKSLAGMCTSVGGWAVLMLLTKPGQQVRRRTQQAQVALAHSQILNLIPFLQPSCQSLSRRLAWHRPLIIHYLSGCRALWVCCDSARRPVECIRLAHGFRGAAAAAAGPR